MDAQTFRTTFGASSDETSEQLEKRAREMADRFFAGRPYELDIEVEEIRTLGGQSLGRNVEVRAALYS